MISLAMNHDLLAALQHLERMVKHGTVGEWCSLNPAQARQIAIAAIAFTCQFAIDQNTTLTVDQWREIERLLFAEAETLK